VPGDPVPDPRRVGQVPWSLYAQGAGFAAVALGGWWAAAHTDGLVHVAGWLLCAGAGLYAAYLLLFSAGWQLLTGAVGTWSGRARRRRALLSGEQLLELRFDSDAGPEATGLPALARLLDERLGPDSECGATGSVGDAVTCHLRGRDLARMLAAVRGAVADVPLPADAYLWVPDLTRDRHGHVLPLRDPGLSPR